MAAMSERDKKLLLFMMGGVGLFLPIYLWFFWRADIVAEAAVLNQRIDSLQAEVDSARSMLALGRAENIEGRSADLRSSMTLMDQLVPVSNELPALIDDITQRAAQRGARVVTFDPVAPEMRGTFQVQRYRLQLIGGYDQIGDFLSDVAALPRIMVPYNVSMEVEDNVPRDIFPDTTVAALRVAMQIRTFVRQGDADLAGGASVQ